ncbi:flagellar hook-length control protein FliK [Maribrevibacterium harenarium]|uniref:Flagellar hook-length control protein FliK n=1 Tax=Maribrevibacterium harenarium TaxID=2589817 RepID=A0A501X2T6_9GAMM|nr:flagellar hook-length control protein FliK [Maribrevibacterium harenarium]TPE54727.1 flagellar hook-length control protein FliK [Maribrevibacterium harenarium]
MINDITSLNTKAPLSPNSAAKNLQNEGVLAKLSSELKLISNLPRVEVINTQAIANNQLIQLKTPQQQSFSVISSNSDTNKLRPGDTLSLRSSPTEVSLTKVITSTSEKTATPSTQVAKNSYQNSTPQPTQSVSIRGQLASSVMTLQAQANSFPVTTSPQGGTPTSPQTFQTPVQINGQSLLLETSSPLQQGESLKVIVDAQGKLQLLPSPTTSAPQVVQSGLTQSLPAQLNRDEMVQTIRQLQQLAEMPGNKLPASLQSAIKQLVQTLPSLNNLTAEQGNIRQALQTSGLFAESNLSQNQHVKQDLKLNLSHIEHTVRQLQQADLKATLPPSLEKLSGAIERITTQQLTQLLDKDGIGQFPLTMELPIKNGAMTEYIGVRIDQDRTETPTPPPHKRRWLVQLKFDFEETGRFESRVSIQEDKVRVLFAVENTATELLIRQNMDTLRQDLRRRKIQIEGMDCFVTKLSDDAPKPTLGENRLIDIRT